MACLPAKVTEFIPYHLDIDGQDIICRTLNTRYDNLKICCDLLFFLTDGTPVTEMKGVDAYVTKAYGTERNLSKASADAI